MLLLCDNGRKIALSSLVWISIKKINHLWQKEALRVKILFCNSLKFFLENFFFEYHGLCYLLFEGISFCYTHSLHFFQISTLHSLWLCLCSPGRLWTPYHKWENHASQKSKAWSCVQWQSLKSSSRCQQSFSGGTSTFNSGGVKITFVLIYKWFLLKNMTFTSFFTTSGIPYIYFH